MTTRGWPGRTKPRCRCRTRRRATTTVPGRRCGGRGAGVEAKVPQRAGDGGVLLAQNRIKEGVGDGEEWQGAPGMWPVTPSRRTPGATNQRTNMASHSQAIFLGNQGNRARLIELDRAPRWSFVAEP